MSGCRKLPNRLLLLLVLCAAPVASRAATDGVVASIMPVHSLVAAVMRGVGEPDLLVEGAATPHLYSLSPREARALEDARLVFWVGEGLETFLAKPLATLADEATVVALHEAPGVTLRPYREGTDFEGEEAHAHGDGHDHARDGDDMHIWLDPDNAKAMARRIALALAAVDPGNAAAYEANAERLAADLDALAAEIEATLAPVRTVPYIVSHDAYQYFERRFGLNAVAALTIGPEVQSGAGRAAALRQRIERRDIACVFAEPQFEPRLARAVTEGTDVEVGRLDPLGTGLDPGPELYFELMREMAESLAGCLARPR